MSHSTVDIGCSRLSQSLMHGISILTTSPLEYESPAFVGQIGYLRDPPQDGVCRWSSWLSHHSTLVMQVSSCPQISSSFSKGQPLPPLQVPEQVVQASLIPPLKKPPKWMRRPAGVSFAVSVAVCVCVCVCMKPAGARSYVLQEVYSHSCVSDQVPLYRSSRDLLQFSSLPLYSVSCASPV